jgi:peroxin-11C
MSQARVVTRFVDSPQLAASLLRSGLKGKSGNVAMDWLTAVQNVCDMLFYPVEHLALLSDLGVVRLRFLKGIPLWDWSCVFWGISIVISLIQTFHKLSTTAPTQDDILFIVRELADLINAIGWMPSGFLWAGKVPPLAVAVLGLISSLLGLRRIIRSRQARKHAKSS